MIKRILALLTAASILACAAPAYVGAAGAGKGVKAASWTRPGKIVSAPGLRKAG